MLEHLPSPAGDLQLEPAVGVAELVTEQVIHLAEPVPETLAILIPLVRLRTYEDVTSQ